MKLTCNGYMRCQILNDMRRGKEKRKVEMWERAC